MGYEAWIRPGSTTTLMSPKLAVIDRELARRELSRILSEAMPFPVFAVSYSEFRLDEVLSALDQVRPTRFHASATLVAAFIEARVPLLTPARFAGRSILSPVIEITNVGPMLLDGVHRALALQRAGVNAMEAFAVHCGGQPPPCQLRRLEDVAVRPLASGLPPEKSFSADIEGIWRPGARVVALVENAMDEGGGR